MARTPLLRRLQALCRAFSSRSHRVTRRQLLQGAAIAGTAALATRARGAAAPRIAIVGGGIAGLSAALTLQDAGVSCTVYEASARIGGRMHSNTTSWENGQVTERCGELIDTGHTAIRRLARRFGLPLADLLAAQPSGSSDTYYFDGGYYTDADIVADFGPVYQVLARDLTAAGYPTLYNSYTPAGAALDRMSVTDWIESRVPGGVQSRLGALLNIAYTIEYGLEASEQSSLNLIYLLGFQPERGVFHTFGESDERFHIKGGNELLPKAIAASLPAGSVILGSALDAIAVNSDATYTLSFRGSAGNRTAVADHVILTIPFAVLRHIDISAAGFDGRKRIAIQQLGYGTNAKLALQFQTRFWYGPGPYGSSTGETLSETGYQNTWEVTRAQDGETGILVDYTGGDAGASFRGNPKDPAVVDGYARRFLNQLEPVLPGATDRWNGRATLDVPARNPFLRGSYSCWKVGQYTLFSGSEGQRSGNCHFAGEHCSTSFQGFMEGAAQEGSRAAREILSDIGLG